MGIYNSAVDQLWVDNVRLVSSVSTSPPLIPGDANYDGTVNDLDAAIVASNWLLQSGANWLLGDFNGDGAVDDSDLTLMAANWQHTPAPSAVPEPATITLCISAAIVILITRRRCCPC